MVMDLSLPDLSGYELLERMAGQDDVSFPPVIVYTGRSLTRDEEQRLRPVLASRSSSRTRVRPSACWTK